MRQIALILALVLAAPAASADWQEYEYPDYSFTVHFPDAPKIENTTYQASDGRLFEARTYSVAQDTGMFKLTVVELDDGGTDENALLGHAVKTMTEGGIIKFDIPHRIRAIYSGRQLGIAGANGGYSYVAVFHHKKRLYQIEGKAFAAGGQAELDAMRFQQSLDLP